MDVDQSRVPLLSSHSQAKILPQQSTRGTYLAAGRLSHPTWRYPRDRGAWRCVRLFLAAFFGMTARETTRVSLTSDISWTAMADAHSLGDRSFRLLVGTKQQQPGQITSALCWGKELKLKKNPTDALTYRTF